MDGAAGTQAKFCGLHAIAELERLLGFNAGAEVIARAIEQCYRAPDSCASPYACAERFAGAAGMRGSAVALSRLSAAAAAPAPATAQPIFRTAEIVQLRDAARIARDDHGNFIERRPVHTDVAMARGGGLADLLRYWQALKGNTAVPSFADIDPVRLAQLGVLGRLHVLNAANPDPLRIRFDLYGNKVPLDNGRIYTGLAIGDHPVRIQAETVAADYDLVRQSAEPHYFRVRKRLGGVGYRYARLVLPFSDGHGRVDRLIVAVRPEPDDGLALNG
jgi:PAS domain